MLYNAACLTRTNLSVSETIPILKNQAECLNGTDQFCCNSLRTGYFERDTHEQVFNRREKEKEDVSGTQIIKEMNELLHEQPKAFCYYRD